MQTTVGEIARVFAPNVRSIKWPPDVFAICALILHKSGAYRMVIAEDFPPSSKRRRPSTAAAKKPVVGWSVEMRRIGLEWRRTAGLDLAPPRLVRRWWSTVAEAAYRPLTTVSTTTGLVHALINLCAAADEACVGVGLGSGLVASSRPGWDPFDVRASLALFTKSTLCIKVDSSRIRVLPKMHTPQTGLTLRSLSHHIALAVTPDVTPRWFKFAVPRFRSKMHVLAIPWPFQLDSSRFANTRGNLRNLPPTFGFFTYSPPENRIDPRWLTDLVAAAKLRAGQEVDLVVFPEAAVDAREHKRLERVVLRAGAMLVSGIAQRATARSPGENFFVLSTPTLSGNTAFPPQHKHHRWRLDQPQATRYGLFGGVTDREYWWEYISVKERSLIFATVHPTIAACVLICEDLARQEPVAELVRAVGPNLVVALLLDGAQKASRWSARYATVLAEDPGCSVLTLTSAGMARLGAGTTRVSVGLWKDIDTPQAKELILDDGAEAISMVLDLDTREEWTADGRSDGKAAIYPILRKTAQIRV